MNADDPTTTAAAESLAEFKDSFFYGARSDLNVKFLADLSSDDAGQFLAEMLAGIGGLLDAGDPDPLVQAFVEWQRRAYSGHLDRTARYTYGDGPFSPLTKPLAECRVALVTSSGHFVEGTDPQPFGVVDMTQAEAEARITEFLRAEPTLSVIPTDVEANRLRVRHGGYPVAAVARDHRVALPIEHLSTLADRGVIGQLSPRAYSFVGATSQLRLRDHIAPDWVDLLRSDAVDAALLVPV